MRNFGWNIDSCFSCKNQVLFLSHVMYSLLTSHGMEKTAVTNSHWSLFTLFTVLSFEQHAIHSRETSYRHFSYSVIEYTIVRHKSHGDIHSIRIILRCDKSLSKEKNEWSSYFCIIRFCTIFARVYREFFRLSDRISSSPSSCLIDYFLM